MNLLWLDDERDPTNEHWHSFFPVKHPRVHWAKDFEAFKNYIMRNGLPDAICFDHDLGTDNSGMDAAKWLVEYCLERNLKMPLWSIQSANPVGKENIASLLNSFERHHR